MMIDWTIRRKNMVVLAFSVCIVLFASCESKKENQKERISLRGEQFSPEVESTSRLTIEQEFKESLATKSPNELVDTYVTGVNPAELGFEPKFASFMNKEIRRELISRGVSALGALQNCSNDKRVLWESYGAYTTSLATECRFIIFNITGTRSEGSHEQRSPSSPL